MLNCTKFELQYRVSFDIRQASNDPFLLVFHVFLIKGSIVLALSFNRR